MEPSVARDAVGKEERLGKQGTLNRGVGENRIAVKVNQLG